MRALWALLAALAALSVPVDVVLAVAYFARGSVALGIIRAVTAVVFAGAAAFAFHTWRTWNR